MKEIRFTDQYGSFCCENPDTITGLYFPLASEKGLKSAITPTLGGDAKTDQNHFLLEPVSIDNLHNNRTNRSFWLLSDGKKPWSATEQITTLEAGLMWHRIDSNSFSFPIIATITSFVPYWCNVEVMQVAIRNTGEEEVTVTPVAAIPIFGRSADNIRDHRHVTSLLHRTTVHEKGIVVNPTLSFDERGHQVNDTQYYVLGHTEDGTAPIRFHADMESFIGEGGNWERPVQMLENTALPHTQINGKEAVGGLIFEEVTLLPGETREYTVLAGICKEEAEWQAVLREFGNKEAVWTAFEKNKHYWQEKMNVAVHTGDERYDMFLRWVSFQPELRRIYGCSFLPHHDYGKGGRGWRDLWQDCLALLLMNPDSVRGLLLSNFGGVRIDGSNATIIGEQQGEFKADRNSITRVWMDHGVWPFITTQLYLNQTGDSSFLYEKMPYFKDRQVLRGKGIDAEWDMAKNKQETEKGAIYEGTVLEHLLLQNLCAFWEVGEHNHIRLRDADWNDAIDMAGERGESVAFTNAYGKNLLDLATLLRKEAERGVESVRLLEEIAVLLQENITGEDNILAKQKLLHEYLQACRNTITGNQLTISTRELADNLERKGQWILEHIRRDEWVTDEQGNGWYNGYYDNSGNRVEGTSRMMLTSQVFSIMAGTATEAQVEAIVKSADAYLYDADCGGYRLNTDFKEIKTDMGRMFGFAYGEKENGAVFSHMAVMFANALYQRGFAREGYKALDSLYRQSMNFEKSRIYPGIPEYFGAGGRGMYHYLTGAASWYMLTVITQMFGVRGEDGELLAQPKLVKEQFDEAGNCAMELTLMNRKWCVEYHNPEHADYGEYVIEQVFLDGQDISDVLELPLGDRSARQAVVLPRPIIDTLAPDIVHNLTITLTTQK